MPPGAVGFLRSQRLTARFAIVSLNPAVNSSSLASSERQSLTFDPLGSTGGGGAGALLTVFAGTTGAASVTGSVFWAAGAIAILVISAILRARDIFASAMAFSPSCAIACMISWALPRSISITEE